MTDIDRHHEQAVAAASRVETLTAAQKASLLFFLCGYSPQAVTRAIDYTTTVNP